MSDRPLLSALLALLLLLGGLPGLTGCGDSGTGPVAVKWDRIACERCRMVLSARNYSAQIRAFEAEGKSALHFFDDIGCAVLWMDQQPWKEGPAIEIWVVDHRNGEWIDARAAYYVTGKTTPMEYGLGAQRDPAPGALSFEQAIPHIYEVEKRFSAEGQVNIPFPIGVSDR